MYEPRVENFKSIYPLFFFLTAGIFLFDVFVPLGIAGGIPYVAAILVISYQPDKTVLFSAAALCSLLTIVGIFFSPSVFEVNMGRILENRLMALFVIWVTAFLSNHRNNLIRLREEALERIHVLEGILPICMECKKIRDLEGNWQRLERYISDRSEARFSHGYCPDCGQAVLNKLTKEFSAEQRNRN